MCPPVFLPTFVTTSTQKRDGNIIVLAIHKAKYKFTRQTIIISFSLSKSF